MLAIRKTSYTIYYVTQAVTSLEWKMTLGNSEKYHIVFLKTLRMYITLLSLAYIGFTFFTMLREQGVIKCLKIYSFQYRIYDDHVVGNNTRMWTILVFFWFPLAGGTKCT